MTHPIVSELVMHHRQQQLLESSARHRQVQHLRWAPTPTLRTRAGLVLVRAGLHLARADPTMPAPHHLAAG